MKRRIRPEGERDKAERVRVLEERLRRELMGVEERDELRSLIARMRRAA